MPSIHLTPAERQDLLAHYRRSADPEVRLRSHILLLLDAVHPWAAVDVVLFGSASTISRWKRPVKSIGRPGIRDAAMRCHLRPVSRRVAGKYCYFPGRVRR